MAGTRRLALIGALVATVLTAGACSSDEPSSGTTAATAPSTVAATGASTGKKTSEASPQEIEQWQAQLNAVGCDAGAVDGIDGGETEAAIRGFQAAAGLTVDGLMGPETESALNADAAAGRQVCTTSATSPGTTQTTADTTPTSASSAPTTASGDCPGPGCIDFSISPSSGPAGTVIEVRSVTGLCTMTGVVVINPVDPTGPSIANGSLSNQGMNQWTGSITVPSGTAPGSYLVNAWATGAMITAGECQAPFTVTG